MSARAAIVALASLALIQSATPATDRVVRQTVTVWDSDAGEMLERHEKIVPSAEDRVESCRSSGIALGRNLVERWRARRPYAFANVQCSWEDPGA